MTDTIHILGFAGSLRQHSYNKALLHTAQALLPPQTTLETFDLIDLPLFNADIEAQGIPSSVLAFRERLKMTDALLIASPEYNYSVTGALKNALDWASQQGGDEKPPLNDLPAAIMGAGGRFGTIRSQLHLREILLHNNLHVVTTPQVAVAFASKEFDENFNLTNEYYCQQIKELLANLRHLTLQLRK